MSNVPKIIIVGGGASGMAAASRLFRSGFVNVTILEASNRTGGRVKSVPAYKDRSYPGSVEMGAQWIHGQTANVAFKIANEAGMVNPDGPDEDDLNEHFVFEGEHRYMREDLAAKFEGMIDSIETKADEFRAPPGLSYGAFCEAEFTAQAAK